MASKKQEIPESKIRIAIWELKKGKTKKHVCETLGIAYNTKRMEGIIQDFRDSLDRDARLKKQAKERGITEAMKSEIINSYVDSGEAISVIAKRLYISFVKAKAVLVENKIPIRARGKHKEGKTEHVTQDLDVKFNKKEKIFYRPESCYGRVLEVYDEDYIDELKDIVKEQYIEVIKNVKNDIDTVEGVHYEVYYTLANGQEWKRKALQYHIQSIETLIEETGREYYKVWLDEPTLAGFRLVARNTLFPIKGAN